MDSLVRTNFQSQYQYTPLPDPSSSIRMLCLTRSNWSGREIDCQLRVFEKGSSVAGKYTAISYTWGDATEKSPLIIDSQRFDVTQNLKAAINYLASKPDWHNSYIWVDAICIDQSNIIERDEQVRRMREIYQNAEKVLIWLGSINGHTGVSPVCNAINAPVEDELATYHRKNQCVALAKLLGALNTVNGLDWEFGVTVNDAFVDILRTRTQIDIALWKHLAELFQASWFERLWIIQELAAAKKRLVVWNEEEFPWEVVENAAKYVLNPGKIKPKDEIVEILPRMGAHRVGQVTLRSTNPDNILTALHNTQEAKCSDPRDRLYAILGVVNDTEDIQIDYSMTVGEVYRQWAERRIRRTRTLDVLSACADSASAGDLPSWVPDLRRPWGQDKILWTQSCDPNTFIPSARVVVEERYLGTWGLKVAELADLSNVGDVINNLNDTTTISWRLNEIITQWELWAQHHGRNVGPSEKSHFAKTILRLNDEDPQLQELYSRWRDLMSTAAMEDVNQVAVNTMFDLRDAERKLFPRIHGCQLFVTNDKHSPIGIIAGNCHASIGDEIWSLLGLGASSKIILRRVGEGYRVIGPCFITSINGYFLIDLRVDSIVPVLLV